MKGGGRGSGKLYWRMYDALGGLGRRCRGEIKITILQDCEITMIGLS